MLIGHSLKLIVDNSLNGIYDVIDEQKGLEAMVK
jgi:hypothetical protein